MGKAILFLAFDGVVALDIVGPLQVFETAARHLSMNSADEHYRLLVASPAGGPVRTSSGLEIISKRLADLADEPIDTIIVPGGIDTVSQSIEPALVIWLQQNATRARRVCSVCVGAFILGAAGLLDGRKVTTHWSSAAALKACHPAVDLRVGPIFVCDEHIWTSAGVSAGIDLALHLIEDDFGRKLAMDVAKTLVVYLRRPGGQDQFSASLELQTTSDPTFSALLDWIRYRLADDLCVTTLANEVGMTPRTFARKFHERVGKTPGQAVEDLRFEAARRMLEEDALSLKEIARRSGLLNEQGLRRTFKRTLGITPAEYRARFR